MTGEGDYSANVTPHFTAVFIGALQEAVEAYLVGLFDDIN